MKNIIYNKKICDSIHGFIKFSEEEEAIINSEHFQKLRFVSQLGITYLMYPGATHTRFEHSLGVMELSSNIFDSIFSDKEIRDVFFHDKEELEYWKQIVRLAALLHDVGHMPFSHCAEDLCLPKGGHEFMSYQIINNSTLTDLIVSYFGKNAPLNISKVAMGQKYIKKMGLNITSTEKEKLLSLIISGDSFGADRIDYLIRDSHNSGVEYGKIDYRKLVESIKIFPDKECDNNFKIGIESSAMQSVESLWIARYMMHTRVYGHRKTRSISGHMRRFISKVFDKSIVDNMEEYSKWTDFVILNEALKSSRLGDIDAKVVLGNAKPFTKLNITNKHDVDLIPILTDIQNIFGEEVFFDQIKNKIFCRDFPVLTSEKRVVSSLDESWFLQQIPIYIEQFMLFAKDEIKEEVIKEFRLRAQI